MIHELMKEINNKIRKDKVLSMRYQNQYLNDSTLSIWEGKQQKTKTVKIAFNTQFQKTTKLHNETVAGNFAKCADTVLKTYIFC